MAEGVPWLYIHCKRLSTSESHYFSRILQNPRICYKVLKLRREIPEKLIVIISNDFSPWRQKHILMERMNGSRQHKWRNCCMMAPVCSKEDVDLFFFVYV